MENKLKLNDGVYLVESNEKGWEILQGSHTEKERTCRFCRPSGQRVLVVPGAAIPIGGARYLVFEKDILAEVENE